MKRALALVALAALAGLLPAPAGAAKKFKKTHLSVPAERHVNLGATIDPGLSDALTLDGAGTPVLLQRYALIVTDVIVTPIASPDTSTAIWVGISLGGRGVEVRRVGAQTHHLSLGGGMAATPNQPISAINHSAVPVRVNVIGYLVDGAALATGESPE